MIKFPRVRFTTSVWPSLWGWLVLLKFRDVSNRRHKVLQKWLKNFVSRSEVIDLGTPCRRTISLKNKLATFTALEVFLHAIKWAILEYLSTTTKTESTLRWVRGSPRMKSNDKSSQGVARMGNDMYKPVFYDCPLAAWHVGHHLTWLPMSLFS